MTLTQHSLSVAGVDITRSVDGLGAIHAEACAAVIWQRVVLPDFQHWIDTLPPAHLPSGRVTLRPDRVRDAVRCLCDAATPDSPYRQMLIDDVATLAQVFSDLVDAPYLRMRLDQVTTNACRRFHSDAISVRLVCTYRGQGTQYGTLGADDLPESIHTTPTGSPVLLRGSRWPETPASGLRHRSPPIEGSGATRLLLVLDPVFDLEGGL